jgi:hypothetical protein
LQPEERAFAFALALAGASVFSLGVHVGILFFQEAAAQTTENITRCIFRILDCLLAFQNWFNAEALVINVIPVFDQLIITSRGNSPRFVSGILWALKELTIAIAF